MALFDVIIKCGKKISDWKFTRKIGLQGLLKYICDANNFADAKKRMRDCKLIGLYYCQCINEQKISRHTYKDLCLVKDLDIRLFKKISNKIFSCNIRSLRRKAKIKIAFLTYSSSIWPCDRLFHLFEQDEKFEPVIVVAGLVSGTPVTTREMYETTLGYFTKRGFYTIGIYDDGGNYSSWIDAEDPDVIFFLTPYLDVILPADFNIQHVHLNKLNVYIPYGFMLARGENNYNLLTPQLCWKYFCDTELYRQLIGEHSVSGNNNVVYCGYTKMDIFYEGDQPDGEKIWKIPEYIANKHEVVKIIYAPHHSLRGPGDRAEGKFSTFDENYRTIFEYAKSHPDTTSWIIRPHPHLKKETVNTGLFRNEDEYEDYLDKWDQLPNAKAVRDGPYFDIFKTSDGMIVDSVSFLAEYQYVGKPLLLLTCPSQEFNEFGLKLKEILYSASGSDIREISNFIDEILIKKNDYMYPVRVKFFKDYLNYIDHNGGKSASIYIYDYFKECFTDPGTFV